MTTKQEVLFGSQPSTKLGDLTETEKEILILVSKEYLTTTQIASRRQISVRAVNKFIKSLKEKGVLTQTNQSILETTPIRAPQSHCNIRLHAQQFRINIINGSSKYDNLLQCGNIIVVDGNKVHLYPTKLVIYSGKDFNGIDANCCTGISLDYWIKFFIKLQNRWGILLVQPRHQNIKLVANHYADLNNELATVCNYNRVHIKVNATEDGKLWFWTDNSHGSNEAETGHPQTAQCDMQDTIAPLFNDYRDHPEVELPSQLQKRVVEQADQIIFLTNLNKELIQINRELFNIMKVQTRLSELRHEELKDIITGDTGESYI